MALDGTEIASIVKRRLGRSRAANIDGDILEEINHACRFYENKPTKFWFQLAQTGLIATNGGGIPGIPAADFLAEYEDGSLFVTLNDIPTECWKDDPYIVKNKTELAWNGAPFYYIQGENLYYKPLNKLQDFFMYYYKKAVPLVTLADTNVWIENAEDLIIGTVGEAIAIGINSPRLPHFQTLRQEAWIDLRRINVARQETNIVRTMGD